MICNTQKKAPVVVSLQKDVHEKYIYLIIIHEFDGKQSVIEKVFLKNKSTLICYIPCISNIIFCKCRYFPYSSLSVLDCVYIQHVSENYQIWKFCLSLLLPLFIHNFERTYVWDVSYTMIDYASHFDFYNHVLYARGQLLWKIITNYTIKWKITRKWQPLTLDP